jgi:hypothetical protein
MKNVVITRKADVGTKMYINSVLKLSNTSTANPSYLATMTPKFGAGNVSTKLDNICFWNKELSPLEVAQLYNNNLGVDYPYNGNLLPSTNDVFGTNHGTLVNGTNFTSGKIGNAFSFDGVNDYVELPTSSLRMTGDFTISCWFYMNTQSTYHALVENLYSTDFSNRYGWALYYQGGKIRFATYNLSTAITQGSTTIATGQWYHLVVTKKVLGTPKIYINGVLESSTVAYGTNTLHPAYNTNNIPRFGVDVDSGVWGGYLNGRLDSVNVWDRELSTNEISLLYNTGNGTQYSSGVFGLTQSSLDSYGTNHGTLTNGTTFTTGKLGQAFLFDGVNDSVNFGTGVSNFGSNPFSISMWFYPNSGNVLQMLYAKGFTGVNAGFYLNIDNRYNSNQNGIQFGVSSGASYHAIATTTANPYIVGAWNHVVVVWDATAKISRIYLNGVLTTTTVSQAAGSGAAGVTNVTNTSANALLGTYGTGGLFFNGRMDSINLWNKVISSDEVTTLYNSGTGVQYPFTTKSMTSPKNQFGLDNGTLMNGCSLTTGKIGQAFTFDGVNDYVALPDNSLNFTGDFSVSAWIYVSNLSGEKYIISNGNGNAFDVNTGWSFGIFNNKISFWVYTGGLSYTGWLTNTTLSVNTWHHVSVTKKTSQSPLLYIDGVLSSNSLWNNTMANSLNPVYTASTYLNTKSSIGVFRYNNGSSAYAYWNGKIDSLNVWQKELTQSEITELYNSGNGKQITTSSIVTNGLVLNLDASRLSSYPNSGTTLYDISGSGYSGTLTNGPVFGTASGGIITFDGTNDYFTISSAISQTMNTIDIWVKVKTTSNSPIIHYGTDSFQSTQWSWGFALYGSAHQFSEAPLGYPASLTDTIDLNVWKNFTLVRNDNNNVKLYKNGVLIGTKTGSGTTSIQSAANRLFISKGGSYYGTFDLGPIKIYDRSLNNDEITQNFNATKSRFGL